MQEFDLIGWKIRDVLEYEKNVSHEELTNMLTRIHSTVICPKCGYSWTVRGKRPVQCTACHHRLIATRQPWPKETPGYENLGPHYNWFGTIDFAWKVAIEAAEMDESSNQPIIPISQKIPSVASY